MDSVFTKGNRNFRKDRLVTHHISKAHSQGLTQLKDSHKNPADLLEPVRKVSILAIVKALFLSVSVARNSDQLRHFVNEFRRQINWGWSIWGGFGYTKC